MRFYRFIRAEKANFPVTMICRVLRVSRSAYYAWDKAQRDAAADPMGGLSKRQVRAAVLTASIAGFHQASKGTYGAPRITADLRDAGHTVSRKTVAKVMRRNGIRGCQPRAFRRTTIVDGSLDTRKDLVRGIWDRRAPDRVWVSDITYLRTWEGWAYLATVIDGSTRQVVGWAFADHMRADLVTDALDMAIARRQPTTPVILHSDRGSVYTSGQLARYARTHRLRLSVGATGVCWDNALAESFFGMLKNELVHRQSWPTRARLRTALVTWIEGFYNARRRHSALGMISPDAYAQRLRYLVAA